MEIIRLYLPCFFSPIKATKQANIIPALLGTGLQAQDQLFVPLRYASFRTEDYLNH